MSRRTGKPELLVDPAWVEARLDDPSVRIIDCTVTLVPQPVGPSRVESGRAGWEAGHIPGAAYLHMTEDLSAPQGDMPYNLPSPEHMTALLRRIGVNQDTTVVLYGRTYPPAVTRAWWVLRASGVRDVRILDGGWQRWVAEGRPTTREVPAFPPGDFVASPVPELLADRDDVRAAIDDPRVLVVNALSPEQFRGTGGAHYGRPGRIPGSVNLPAMSLVDPETRRYRSFEELEVMFAAAGAFDHERVIAYCGGGIAASSTVFVLEMLGHPSPGLYDRSLLEWAKDPDLPTEVG
jgi:thiosulfate/3-mercaptopyruvate sulfurtransferase